TGTINLSIGEAERDVDAGLVQKDTGTASLGDTVWYDANKNGTLDAGEGRAQGVTVQLINPTTGAVIATQVTDANGNYLFSNLNAGNYQVKFVAPNGYEFTTQSTVAADAVNNDSDAGTGGLTGTINLSIGEAERDVDAGLVQKDTGTASLGDTVWYDANKNGTLDAGEGRAQGVTVQLINPTTGAVIATQVTDANGNYLFSNLNAGNYQVKFVAPNGYEFTTQSTVAPDAVNNDSDAGTGGLTGTINLSIGEAERDVDAGLVKLNNAPDAKDDGGKTCADMPKAIDVLANDTDPNGDNLTITQVAGQTITEGQTVTASDGVKITLTAGQLVFDATGTSYEAALIGTHNNATYSYQISDGNGGFDTANVAMTFCGATNTLQTIEASLPAGGNLLLTLDKTFGGDFYNATLSGTGDDRFDGIIFEAAYCLSAYEPISTGVSIPYNFYLAKEGSVPTGVVSHPEYLDSINWILNQDFTSQDNGDNTGTNYTEAEIQGAIWGLTDNIVFVQNGLGTNANANEIYQLAKAQGDGYVPGEGDIVGLVLDPTAAAEAAGNAQPFIIGVPFDELTQECVCV
ncbi:SdrD B-like domain-containing protein, partial [Paracoccus sp. (in: a-proteobacteria)]|uniref:SdrD B-like domain-containing protein n=1 Tax=Paracoccus sp. TaxID=267 RepID=UPI003A86A761